MCSVKYISMDSVGTYVWMTLINSMLNPWHRIRNEGYKARAKLMDLFSMIMTEACTIELWGIWLHSFVHQHYLICT